MHFTLNRQQMTFSEPRSYWWWSSRSLFEAVLIGAEVIKRWPPFSPPPLSRSVPLLLLLLLFLAPHREPHRPTTILANERTLLWEMAASWLITRSSPNLGVQPRRRKVVGEIPVGASERESDRWRGGGRARISASTRKAAIFFSFSLYLILPFSLVLTGARNALVPNIRCRMDRQVICSSITLQLTCPHITPGRARCSCETKRSRRFVSTVLIAILTVACKKKKSSCKDSRLRLW